MSRRSGSGRSATDADQVPGHVLRVGHRLDEVLERARPGDALVVDVLDMDRPTARRILATAPSAVLNASPSFSGRFPVTGPSLVVESGVLLVDDLQSQASLLRDGERIEIREGQLLHHGEVLASGRRRRAADLAQDAAAADASGGVRVRTEALVADTVALLRAAGSTASLVVPDDVRERVGGRAVVVVTGSLTSSQAKALDAIPGRMVVAAGDEGLVALDARRLKAEVIVGAVGVREEPPTDEEPTRSSRRRRPTDRADEPAVRLPAPSGRSLSDGAAALMLAAGAAAVVVAGPEGVDDPLMGLLDRPRIEAASTGLLRLDAGGRLVALSTLEALTEGPRASGPSTSRPLLESPRRRAAAIAAAGVAILLIGILLGSGPLAPWSPTGTDPRAQQARIDELASSKADLARQVSAADAFIASQQQKLVAGQLTGRRVVIVSAADVEPAVVEGIVSIVTRSGATVPGTVRLTPAFTAPARQSSFDDLATRLAPTTDATPTTAPGARLRSGLAASISTPAKASVGVAVPQGAGLLDALVQVGALQVTGDPSQRSDLVVLAVPDQGSAASSKALAELGSTLARQSVVTVMSTPGSPAAGSAAALAAAAPDPSARLSTSEQVARAVGQVALINALVSGTKGRFGVFGG